VQTNVNTAQERTLVLNPPSFRDPFEGRMPRPEYPRPQFEREQWLCLNGVWGFEIDAGDTGVQRKLIEKELSHQIVVPFCPEAPLSGVHHVDQMNVVWYRKTVTIPSEWAGKKVMLNFGAVDYDATVYINEKEAYRHRGGFSPFCVPLEQKAGEEITIVVRARDYLDDPKPRGKQSQMHNNYGCMYYRTTGIWQTVWMEPVPEVHFYRPRITPDVSSNSLAVELPLSNSRPGYKVRVTLSDDKGEIQTLTARADVSMAPRVTFNIPDERVHLWSVGDGFLYDLRIELLDKKGNVVDEAKSYAGLRSVAIDGKAITINGERIFQRLVLDQGFYPDGIFTAGTDEELIEDIQLGIDAGFNGARLHQKVFEERYLYHADRMGYGCWGEFADWGARGGFGPDEVSQKYGVTWAAQWMEVLERDYSKPSIIGWCPLNETWEEMTDHFRELDDATRALWECTKTLDKTRPVLDASGYSHRVPETDVYDSHDYEQDHRKFKKNQAGLAKGQPFQNDHYYGVSRKMSTPYQGQPYFVSEFGGIKWDPQPNPETGEMENRKNTGESWGYGAAVRTLEDFYERFEKLCGVLLDDPNMFGYCYTQLTDVYQEVNGIYNFDRSGKFDIERIKAAQVRPAAIEKKK
jgi:beta-galactosidase/beta-glucuronidase